MDKGNIGRKLGILIFQITGVFGSLTCSNSSLFNCHAKLVEKQYDIYAKCKELFMVKDCLEPYLDICSENAFFATILSEEFAINELCNTFFNNTESTTARTSTVFLSLKTDNVLLGEQVKMLCCSNNSHGTWYIFKGFKLLFEDENIGNEFNKTKFDGHILNATCYEFQINDLKNSDLDNYTCTHRDQQSLSVNLQAALQHVKVFLRLETQNVLLGEQVKMLCCSNSRHGTWYIFKGFKLLFEDENIGNEFNKTKFEGHILNATCYEFKINDLERSDLDNYTCTHRDQRSQSVNLQDALQHAQHVNGPEDNNVLAIVFGVLGALVGIVVLLVVFRYIINKRRQ